MADKKAAISDADRALYWRKNVTCMLVLLAVWFFASFGCGILFVDQLNEIRLGGFKLGFWFAQQGSIYVFVVLIAVYVVYMNKLDLQFHVEEHEEPEVTGAAPESATDVSGKDAG